MASLAGITLPIDTTFINEHEYSATSYNQQFTISGRQALTIFTQQTGQPIKLNCQWLTLETLTDLKALPDEPLTLILPDNREFQVMLDKRDLPFEVEPVIEYNEYQITDYFSVIINLITV